MNYRNIFFLLSLCLCFNTQHINAKNSKKYTVKEIDSIAIFLDTCKFNESILEGTYNKGKKLIGGYTMYHKKDKNSHLYRIISEDNTRKYFRATFYFVKRKIIKIIVNDYTFFLNNNKPMFIKDKKQIQFIKILLKDGMKLPY